MHSHISLALPPWKRDLRLLRAHHSAPLYTSGVRMGKSGKAKQQPWKDGWTKDAAQGGWWKDRSGQDQRSRSWQLWRGSWGSPAPAGGQGGSRYDQVELKEEPAALRPGLGDLTAASEKPVALMQAIQRALTASRRADTRMRKLREEKDKRDKQWQQWATDHKTAYFAQLKEYESDISRLTEEMNSTATTGKAAADQITQLVAHGLPEEEQAPRGAAADASWEQFLLKDQEMEASDGCYFQEALAATRMLGTGRQPVGQTPPVLQIRPEILQQLLLSAGGQLGPSIPVGGPIPPGLGSPLKYAASPPGAPSGPALPAESVVPDIPHPAYGPLLGPKDRRSSPLHPGQRDPNATRVPTAQEPPRESVKEATKNQPAKPTGGSGLQAKLDAKRAMELQGGFGTAMHPFRGGANVPGMSPRTGDGPNVSSDGLPVDAVLAAAAAEVIADEDLPEKDGTRSPGLHGLG